MMAASRAFRAAAAIAVLAVAGCSTAPKKTAPAPPGASHPRPVDATPAAGIAPTPRRTSPYAPAQEDLSKRGDYVAGGLYAPGVRDTVPDHIPDVDAIPEPDVRAEPRSRYGNRSPYNVLGKTYAVRDSAAGYVEQGKASYYGNKFHGRRTSNMEVYDMYAFTAAHRTLPLPSFARVTNLDNGKSVIVRVNDRGPFHSDRIIDLSYAAAVKLGYRDRGTARVEVRGLAPGEVPVVADAGPALPPAAVPQANRDLRFDMMQNGKVMTADEFDAWMRSRQVRVATGRPGTPEQRPVAVASAAPAIAEPVPANAIPLPARPLAPPPAAPATAAALMEARVPDEGAVTLQVASFANADNARHALGLLQGAGIAGARLQEAAANGRPIWRLRIGPVASSAAPQLAASVAGLGFGVPQRVRD